MWGLYILFFISLAFFSHWIPELNDNSYEDTALNDMLTNSPFKLFVLACIFAPIVEEMMFRTLIKPTHIDLILFLSSWPVFMGLGFLPPDIHWGVSLVFGAVVIFVLYYILKHLIAEEATQHIRTFFHTYTVPILIVVSVVFGLVHINNYVDNFIINAALITLIVPRIISGFMMGWIKIKNQGLIWSMGLHFMNNAFVVGIGILAS